MGMAASQARFLELTARKSNVEYQGQQINQQRTALANESSNIYAQLSKMEVPTPPVVADFYKTVYNFSTKDLNTDNKLRQYTLEDIKETPAGTIAYISTSTSYFSVVAPSNPGTIKFAEKYEDASDEDKKSIKEENWTGYKFSSGTNRDIYIQKMPANEAESDLKYLANTADGGKDVFKQYYKNDGTIDSSQDVYFYKVGNNTYYLSPDDVEKLSEDATYSPSASYRVGENTTTTTIEYPVVNYEKSDVGRYTSVQIYYEIDEATGDFKTGSNDPSLTFDLECTRVEDEEAFEQAQMDYEHAKAKYDKECSDLNNKLAEIQEKDKTLELQLKQLDTEQNALKTEMDAVSKVTEDNIESTFKTFA